MISCMLSCLCFTVHIVGALYRVWFGHLCLQAHQAQWRQWRSQGQVYLYCPPQLSQSLKHNQRGSEDKSLLLKNQTDCTQLIKFSFTTLLNLPKPSFGSFFRVTQTISLSGGVLVGVSTAEHSFKILEVGHCLIIFYIFYTHKRSGTFTFVDEFSNPLICMSLDSGIGPKQFCCDMTVSQCYRDKWLKKQIYSPRIEEEASESCFCSETLDIILGIASGVLQCS